MDELPSRGRCMIFYDAMGRKTVTFVCHTAGRSGAPLTLLRTLRELRNCPWDVRVLLLQDGPLHSEFASVCPTDVQSRRTGRRWIDQLRERLRGTGNFTGGVRPDLYVLYSHTYDFLHTAAAQGVPVLSFVHEVPISFAQLTSETRSLLRTYPLRVLGVSRYVCSMLHDHLGVPQDRIVHVPAGVDCSYWQPELADGSVQRRELGIPSNAVVVGGAGQLIPLKGIDLWLRAGARLSREFNDRPVHFIWTGGIPDGSFVYAELMKAEAARLGIADRVHFVGEQADPRPWYSACDIFALTSRTESLSLVCIEHSLLGKPVVAFHGTGGPAEFADMGFVSLVPDLDTDAMADEIRRLIDHPSAAAALVTAGHAVIPERYDIHKNAGRLSAEIGKLLHTSSTSV